jgi:hypothetical protein
MPLIRTETNILSNIIEGVVCSDGSRIKMDSGGFTFVLPIYTVSEANGLTSKTRFYKNGKPKPEHWTEKSQRHKVQKGQIYLALCPVKDSISLPCVVKMIRMAPHYLDADDNLRIALKWIKDAIAEVLTGDHVPGRADNDARITWRYDQEKSKEYKVRIQICG